MANPLLKLICRDPNVGNSVNFDDDGYTKRIDIFAVKCSAKSCAELNCGGPSHRQGRQLSEEPAT